MLFVHFAIFAVTGLLQKWGFELIDCQVETEHLSRFGAEHWPRARYLEALQRALQVPTRQGPWTEPPKEEPTG